MWTRNYNNLINAMVSISNSGLNGVSSNPFDDTYLYNYKDCNGTRREICNHNTSSSYAHIRACPAFVYTDNGSSFSAAVNTTNDPTAALSGNDTYSYNKIIVAFGSSATEATYDDYTLKAIITTFSKNSGTVNITKKDDGTFRLDYKIIITATADITIREIGILLPIPYYYGGSNHSRYALINRIVLDEPISVASGEVANVTFSITTPKISISQ